MIGTSGWSMHAPSILTRLLVFTALSAALMIADHRGQHLERIRMGLSVLLSPIQYAAALPSQVGDWAGDFFGGDRKLRQQYEQLSAEVPLLQARLQKYEALATENEHLRQLLGSAARVAERAVVAELVEVSREPFTRQITVAKGKGEGLFVGQPVLDAHGIMGQIAEVGVLNSRATLITDPGHAIPVQVNRNGLRAIAFGVGHPDRVEVRYLTSSADIQQGDLLISSGIGSNFPFGYPVAEVTKIVNDPNEAFLEVIAKPVAQLGHNKEVLLIWPAEKAAHAPANPAPAAAAKPASPAPKP